MDVVVDMLACNHWGHRVGLAGSSLDAGVSELGSLLFETGLDGGSVTVAMLTVLDRGHVVEVLFGEDLTILDRLDGGMVVVLVDLTVNGGGDLLMALLLDGLIHNGRGDLLVDGSVMVTRLVPENVMRSAIVQRDTSRRLEMRVDGRRTESSIHQGKCSGSRIADWTEDG